jgi:hypothetical protein
MTLLTIVQDACDELGINQPSTVIGNADAQVKQLLALSNRGGKVTANRPASGWQALVQEATFTTVATASQGSVETIAPNYKYIINQTIWNRDERRPVFGPLTPQDWQLLQASPVTGPWDQFRIRGGNILFDPVPKAGQTCAFEYVTKQWCESSGGTGQVKWAADDDVARLDEDLLTLDLIWRWRAAKKLDYSEEFAEFERYYADIVARDGTKPILNGGGGITDFVPGIFVPQTGYGQ